MNTNRSPQNDPTAELLRLAFEAGREGADWLDFTFREDVETLVEQVDSAARNEAFFEFERGQLEHKLALLPDGRGWIIVWTTAPADYDSFGAETITAEIGAWFGKTLRSVAVDPRHASYQRDRYCSGLCFVGDEDPRVEAARTDALRTAWAAEKAERERRTAAGEAWLRGLSDEALEHVSLDDGDEYRRATREQVREQRAARSAARHEASRKARWERDTATVPEGSTIVDRGTRAFRGIYGWITGQPTRVYYAITYGRAWERDPETADIDSGAHSINLGWVAEEIRKGGRFAIVDPSSVPPRAVLDRIGHENLQRIVCVSGVYVYQQHSWSDVEYYAANGKKIPSKTKKAREAFEAILAAQPIIWAIVDFLRFAEKF